MTKTRDICLPAVPSQPPSLLDILFHSALDSFRLFVVKDGDWAPERLFFDNSESPVQIPDSGLFVRCSFSKLSWFVALRNKSSSLMLIYDCWVAAERLLQQHWEPSPNFQLPSFVSPCRGWKRLLIDASHFSTNQPWSKWLNNQCLFLFSFRVCRAFVKRAGMWGNTHWSMHLLMDVATLIKTKRLARQRLLMRVDRWCRLVWMITFSRDDANNRCVYIQFRHIHTLF